MSREKLRHSKAPEAAAHPVYCLSWLAGNYGWLIFSRLGAARTQSLGDGDWLQRGTGQLGRERDIEPGLRVRICQHLHLAAIEETGDPSPPHPSTARVPSRGQWNPSQGGCRGLRPRPRGSPSLLHQAAPHSGLGQVGPTLPHRTKRSSLVLQLSHRMVSCKTGEN